MILIEKYSKNKNRESISHHVASLPRMKEALLSETKNRDISYLVLLYLHIGFTS